MTGIKEIEKQFAQAADEEYEGLYALYAADERQGVQKIIAKYHKKQEKLLEEYARIERMLTYERACAAEYSNSIMVCGIDEAGRGPLAGPVVAGAVILPKDCSKFLYVNDSKQLSEKKREELYDIIMEGAVSVGIGMASPGVIDEINILQATYQAMRKAISQLDVIPDVLLNDAVTIPGLQEELGLNPVQKPIIKGDAKSLSIAAASIVAKVTRDRIMREYDVLYPEYGFAAHKGYGCASHIQAIREYGPCPIHRATFIKNFSC